MVNINFSKHVTRTCRILLRTLCGCVILAVSLRSVTASAGSLTLVVDGLPAATIVLAAQPTCAAQLAAYELQHHIRLMTDATLPIRSEGEEGIAGIRIAIGATKEAAAAGLTPDAWQPQEYAIKILPDSLVLAGQDALRFDAVVYDTTEPMAFGSWPDAYEAQGTLHAAYEFLERGCGVRWFTPTEVGTHIPRSVTLTIELQDLRRRPAFAYRDLGHFMNISEAYPYATIIWKPDSPQARAWEEQAFAALHKRFPNRWPYIHAQRGQCRLFLYRKRMGGCEPYASNHSFYGYYDRFLKTHPEWFAQGYDNADKPPQMCYTNPEFIAQVVPATNVSVQLCLHARNVYDTAMQQNDRTLLDVWARDPGRRILLWLYYCFPNMRGQQANPEWRVFPGFFAHTIGRSFKVYHEKKVRGAFFDGWCNDIDAYVTFAMLDDPTREAEDLLTEYFTGYFGAAAEPMQNFYQLVEQTYCDPANYQTNPFGTVGHQTQTIAWDRLGTAERMEQLGRYMQQAEALAQTDTEKKRFGLFKAGTWDYMYDGIDHTNEVARMESWAKCPGMIEQMRQRKPVLSVTNALSGHAFVAETAGMLFITQQGDKTEIQPKVCTTYTDGELHDTFINGDGDTSLRCDLGDLPPEGRQLRRLRLIWSLNDSYRCRLDVQWFVRDAATGAWRAISQVITDTPRMSGGYGVLSLPFPEGGVTGFDALRLVDRSGRDGRPSTRICEIEAEIK